ncbi:unnamed protein product [Toxocara canis]|uniref:Bestrophin homolog n=1 Tax=Toxocara canis TaxID=6265 RepID=A0A183UBN9_TOXCA|nr:unnamed protein product [Toxocara canis]
MTVSYNRDVATSRPWTLFRVLMKWRGSIWKSILVELAIWMSSYAALGIVYRLILNSQQRAIFERISDYCDEKMGYFPLNMMLGFYVNCIVDRWRKIVSNIGFIDNISLLVSTYVDGFDEKSRIQRRNIIRYCCLAQVLVLRDMSMRVRRRFPTLDTVVAAGFMLEHEKELFDSIKIRYAKYWMPFQWALALLYDVRHDQKIDGDIRLNRVVDQPYPHEKYPMRGFHLLVKEIITFRKGLGVLCSHDSVPIPIMYPQLVYLAVHAYFIVCLISRQHIVGQNSPKQTPIDVYIPFMTILQFVFYVGWLKVAEAMLNPLGEDDDDYESNTLIDRNLTVGLTIVDEAFREKPTLHADMFWADEIAPLYSAESALQQPRGNVFNGSTANVK